MPSLFINWTNSNAPKLSTIIITNLVISPNAIPVSRVTPNKIKITEKPSSDAPPPASVGRGINCIRVVVP
jgi:hypothetical protein